MLRRHTPAINSCKPHAPSEPGREIRFPQVEISWQRVSTARRTVSGLAANGFRSQVRSMISGTLGFGAAERPVGIADTEEERPRSSPELVWASSAELVGGASAGLVATMRWAKWAIRAALMRSTSPPSGTSAATAADCSLVTGALADEVAMPGQDGGEGRDP